MSLLNVFIYLGRHGKCQVGRLAYKDGIAYLEPTQEFIDYGVNISPYKLSLASGLTAAERTPFNGLHGVFADSLPDGWGLMLTDRWFKEKGTSSGTLTPLERLSFMGDRTMGALSYEPATHGDELNENNNTLSLVSLANDALKIYQGSMKEVTEELYLTGSSPGGAHPKALIGLRGDEAVAGVNHLPEGYQHWIVKFPTGAGRVARSEGITEYIYSLMAVNAGIDFPETQLIQAGEGLSFFACRRFDRTDDHQRVHMHTMAGLLHADFRVPDSDYEMLIRLTSGLTSSHEDMREAFKRMLFNVLAGNRDDHTKNFSFLMADDGAWSLSPAYDVTFNVGISGHHSMSIMGEGQQVSLDAIKAIADKVPLQEKEVAHMIDEVASALSQWRALATDYGVPDEYINEVGRYIDNEVSRIAAKVSVNLSPVM